jgi:uncharacterized protein with von Willebrand factor type A (vWA) domain
MRWSDLELAVERSASSFATSMTSRLSMMSTVTQSEIDCFVRSAHGSLTQSDPLTPLLDMEVMNLSLYALNCEMPTMSN